MSETRASFLRWAFALPLLLLVAACSTPHPLSEEILRLDSAISTTSINGETQRHDATLPYHWDKLHPGLAGSASFEFGFNGLESWRHQTSGIGMLIPKLGNTYRIHLNGELLAGEGDLVKHNATDHALLPHLFFIPESLIQSKNTLIIDIKADIGRKGGLSAPLVGPMAQLERLHNAKLRWYVFGTLLVSLFSLFAGGVALALWITTGDDSTSGWSRRDPLYGYATVAELTWAFGVIYVFIESPAVPWPWWGMLTIMALAVWSCNMALFCIEAIGRQNFPYPTLLRNVLRSLLWACPFAAYFALGAGAPMVLTIWYAMLGVTVCFLLGFFLRSAASARSIPNLFLAAAIAINLTVGLHDLYAVRIDSQYDKFTLTRFSSVLFGLALLYIVVNRFLRDRAQARDLLLTLESRVDERERQLKMSFSREEELLRESERADERRRVLQDMHDSVGAHLSLAIRQIESQKVQPHQLLNTLRESMDQLKLSIDSVNLPPGNINSLLANLRYRMGTRIELSGLKIDWNVDDLPRVDRLDVAALKQLQFIIYEAISNVLQHAKASRIAVEARHIGDAVHICVADNGIGFSSAAAHGKGLVQMKRRAMAVGAQLAIDSHPGSTRITLVINDAPGEI